MTAAPQPDGPLVGVVLCGGSSSRMGFDKATLSTPVGPLAAIAAKALVAAGCTEVLLVGGDDASLQPIADELGLRWIPDHEPGEGPLGGLCTAAHHRPDTALVVCACDLPWISGPTLMPLIEAVSDASEAAVAVYELDGVGQWSTLALSGAASATLAQAFEAGERSLHRAANSNGLIVKRLVPLDPESICDVDVPEDLPPSWSP